MQDAAFVRVLQGEGYLADHVATRIGPRAGEWSSGGEGRRGVERCDDGSEHVGAGQARRVAAAHASQDFGERATHHPLHREVGQALVLPDGVNRDDAGVLQARDGLGFAVEALERAGEVELAGAQQLERHLATEADLLGQPDHTHSAAADALEEAKVAELLGECPGFLAWGRRLHLGQQGQPYAQLVGELGVLATGRLDSVVATLVGRGQAIGQERLDRVERDLVVRRRSHVVSSSKGAAWRT